MLLSHCERLAYLAGYFDGEGSISPVTDPKRKARGWSPCARVELTNTDRTIINEMQAMFGGNVIAKKNLGTLKGNKPQWMWYAAGANARRFLTSIYPYLRHQDKIRKAQSALIYDEAMGHEKKA